MGSDLKKLTNPASSDGIAVDTDHVVYIENGPNYYTYTFRVIRDNASENAPLENLVLSPLTDGTYRKLLFTYHLTPQEKQTLIDGGDVDTTGKITITDLGNNQGLPYGGMMNKNTNCQWVQVTSYTICSEGVHGGGKTKGCTATTKSIKLTSSIFLCDPDAGEGSSGGGDPGGGGPSGGGTGYCSPNGALTGPQVPNDGMGMTPCEGGIPTIPNPGGGFLPPIKDPCEKAAENNINAKKLLNETKISTTKTQLTATLSSDTNEKSFSFGKDASGNYDTTPINSPSTGNQTPVAATYPNLTIEGGAHTHTIDLYNCFSAGDIYSLQGANAINFNFKTMFVFANGGVVYALTITDPVKYADFVANKPAGIHLDMSTSHWKPTSPIYLNFEMVMAQFKNQGLSDDDAYATAIAFILNKYDIGATLSQKDATGNFNSMFVNENIINVNVGGVSVPLSTYSQTTTCNLK